MIPDVRGEIKVINSNH